MSNTFAKLFETERGQILVKIDTGEGDAPEIRFYVSPEGLGVCSVALTYKDSDSGWDTAEKSFEKIDQAMAMEITREVFEMAGQVSGVRE